MLRAHIFLLQCKAGQYDYSLYISIAKTICSSPRRNTTFSAISLFCLDCMHLAFIPWTNFKAVYKFDHSVGEPGKSGKQ